VKFRLNGSVIASLAIHVVVMAAVFQALVAPHHFVWIFAPRAASEGASERIHYIAPAAAPAAPVTRAPSPGVRPAAERPAPPRPAERTAAPAPPRLVAPAAIPTGIPEARPIPTLPTVTRSDATGGDPDPRGTVALVPNSTDPRLWTEPAPYAPPALSNAEYLEQSLGRYIRARTDSAAAVAARTRRPGDWTVDRDGGKYGIDSERIYFGKYSIPTMILALLPIRSVQANPNMTERAERIGQMSSEIRERAAVGFDARDEVKAIAARKDRERAARLRAQQSGQGTGSAGNGSGSAGSGSGGSGSGTPPPPSR
jgi:hypothetical protein